MQNLEQYFNRAINNNQLKLKGGQRNWRKYFLVTTELEWVRNLHDGYSIDVFTEKY